jgi:hypothetical protein
VIKGEWAAHNSGAPAFQRHCSLTMKADSSPCEVMWSSSRATLISSEVSIRDTRSLYASVRRETQLSSHIYSTPRPGVVLTAREEMTGVLLEDQRTTIYASLVWFVWYCGVFFVRCTSLSILPVISMSELSSDSTDL